MAVHQRAVAFGFFLRGDHFGFQFLLQRFVLVVGPDAEADQVLLQAGDGVAQREVGPVVGGRYLDGSSEVECGPAR